MRHDELPEDLSRLSTWKVAAYPPDEEVEALTLDDLCEKVIAALRPIMGTLNYYIGPNARTAVSPESVESFRRIQHLLALCDPEYRKNLEFGVRREVEDLAERARRRTLSGRPECGGEKCLVDEEGVEHHEASTCPGR